MADSTYDEVLEKLCILLEDTGAMPDVVLRALPEAWAHACLERQKTGEYQIKKMNGERTSIGHVIGKAVAQ